MSFHVYSKIFLFTILCGHRKSSDWSRFLSFLSMCRSLCSKFFSKDFLKPAVFTGYCCPAHIFFLIIMTATLPSSKTDKFEWENSTLIRFWPQAWLYWFGRSLSGRPLLKTLREYHLLLFRVWVTFSVLQLSRFFLGHLI